MPVRSCRVCPNTFYVKPSHLKMGYGKYCSTKCWYSARKTGKIINCHICGKEAYKGLKALRQSKSKKYFCGKSCQTKWRNAEFVGSKHANFVNGNSSYKSILGRHKIPKICVLCSVTDSRILAVHHIDENHQNNDLKNLAWLCHNCHFLVHHDKVEKVKFLTEVEKK
jgi:hypothetical protein